MVEQTSWLDQLFSTQVYVQGADGSYLNIGYFTGSNVPCSGNIFVYSDFLDEFNKGWYPASSWLILDWTRTHMNSVTQYCVDKGLAPAWSKQSGSAVVADSPSGPVTVHPKASAAAVTPERVVAAVAAGMKSAGEGLQDVAAGVAKPLALPMVLIGVGVVGALLLSRR